MPDDWINLFGVPWYGFCGYSCHNYCKLVVWRLSHNFNRAFKLSAIAPPAAKDEQCVPAACTVVAAYLLIEHVVKAMPRSFSWGSLQFWVWVLRLFGRFGIPISKVSWATSSGIAQFRVCGLGLQAVASSYIQVGSDKSVRSFVVMVLLCMCPSLWP